jgi:hypothetical protein
MEKLQIDLNRLGVWAVENVMIINPAKSKAVCFTRARDGNTKLFVMGYSNSKSEQLYILGNNFTQRFNLG